MKYEVREAVGWSNKEPIVSNYGIYVDGYFPDDLDFKSLKKLAKVINQFIEKKEGKE